MRAWQILLVASAIVGWSGLLWWVIGRPFMPSRRERAIRRAMKGANNGES